MQIADSQQVEQNKTNPKWNRKRQKKTNTKKSSWFYMTIQVTLRNNFHLSQEEQIFSLLYPCRI